jgi:hypothetical protein
MLPYIRYFPWLNENSKIKGHLQKWWYGNSNYSIYIYIYIYIYISILSVFWKIVEKLMYNRLILFINIIQSVPLDTEPGISLIILTPMKILQWNLNRSMFVVWEMKRNVSVVSASNFVAIFVSGKIIKEMPGSVASGTPYILTCSARFWRW